MLDLIVEHQNTFQWNDSSYGRTDAVEHKIDTGDTKPIRQRQYRLSPLASAEIEKQVTNMQANGLIEESQSPWCNPTIIVMKKSSEPDKPQYRFCIDFRVVNQNTVKDSFPLPRIDETIEALAGAIFFTTFDLYCGYWQVPVAMEDRPKTAFRANNKLYQYKVMPFGLCNAPSTFMRLMDRVLRHLTWKCCLVYLDDIIIFSIDFQTHLVRIKSVLVALDKANLKLKPEKCRFAMKRVNYLGFNISAEGVLPDNTKVQAIAAMRPPSSKEEVRRFIGMISYYRKFIKDFGKKSTSLCQLTDKNTLFVWSDEHESAFEKLKQDLVRAPILIYPISMSRSRFSPTLR